MAEILKILNLLNFVRDAVLAEERMVANTLAQHPITFGKRIINKDS